MKIVAFLQNMWVLPHQVAHVSRWPATGDKRERMIHYALFAGCLTGRRLSAAFGDLCDDIIWQEASPVVSANSKEYFPPDPNHIKAVLAKHDPVAVLCLTRRGQDIILELCKDRIFVSAPHPAARGASVISDLEDAATTLRFGTALRT